MKKGIAITIMIVGSSIILIAIVSFRSFSRANIRHPLAPIQPGPNQQIDANKYSIPALKNTNPSPTTIELQDVIEETPLHRSYQFKYVTDGKVMTGQLNLPLQATPSAGFPIIVMLRGFVDPSQYQTGIGTKNAAAVFADNGYATIAPDQLGYGQSDDPDPDVFIARFQRPRHIQNLLASIEIDPRFNPSQVGIWAHSNGGQIALSVLEITGHPYPTTLWAPVSKPFPYSILYYTDEYQDNGKALRQELALLEQQYDVNLFSITQYIDFITAPIQIHQGTADDAVPLKWSQQLASALDQHGITNTLFIYPQADHNLRPSWDTVINRDIEFFQAQFSKTSQ